MATGALDANGIWQYGEDDSETTFSGLLNKLASSTSDTVTRLEGFTGFTGTLPTSNLPTVPINKGGTNATTAAAAQDNLGVGSVVMVPSSVSYTSGSAPTLSNGTVLYPNNTSIVLNGVFTSGFRNYRVVFRNYYAVSGSGDFFFRLTSSGIASTTGYWLQGLRVNNGTLAAWNNTSNGTVAAFVQYNTSHDVGLTTAVIDIMSPQLASKTEWVSTAFGMHPTAAFAYFASGGFHSPTTSYDGIQITTTAGSVIEGDVTVYGWN